MNQGAMPAYPLRVAEDGYMSTYRGMSKREAFAMAAMQGMLSGAPCWPDMRDSPEIARRSLACADALLAALEATP